MTGSTNADLMTDLNAVEGDWLVARYQNAGRGRQGRDWTTIDGNFFGSTLVKLQPDDPSAAALALVAALALIEASETIAPGRDFQLKWPNDLMLDGGKLAGILLERSGDRVVVGFGVNLADAPDIEGRKTASLDATMAPTAFAPILAASFARLLAAWRSSDPASIAMAWMQRAHPVGTRIRVHDGDGAPLAGRFVGLEEDGALRLELEGGEVRIIRAGDVALDSHDADG